MNAQELHDVKNLLVRLGVMAEILTQNEFSDIPREEVLMDLRQDLNQLEKLFQPFFQ